MLYLHGNHRYGIGHALRYDVTSRVQESARFEKLAPGLPPPPPSPGLILCVGIRSEIFGINLRPEGSACTTTEVII